MVGSLAVACFTQKKKHWVVLLHTSVFFFFVEDFYCQRGRAKTTLQLALTGEVSWWQKFQTHPLSAASVFCAVKIIPLLD